jgi:hypothetical protein
MIRARTFMAEGCGIGFLPGGKCLSIPMSKPLRAGINELVVEHLKDRLSTGERIDVAEMTYEIAQSLVDVIMEQEEDGRGVFFAYALKSLGEEYLQRHGVFETTPKDINRAYRNAARFLTNAASVF